jgi:peptidoglycan/xylan/chitin deacetylase (PgdA/CDA1 family)
MKTLLFFLMAFASLGVQGEQRAVEIHDQLATQAVPNKKIALTLDACGGKYDDDLIEFLIKNRIPATIFATKKWLDQNPHGLSDIKAHLDLFDVEVKNTFRR